MKLYREEQGWAERLVAAATPSIRLRSAIPSHLTGLRYQRERLKIHVRALLHRRQAPAWLQLLNSHPAFSDYIRTCPRFLYKAFRPYNSHALDADARLAALRAHYAFVFRRGLGQLVARASLGPVVLAAVTGKNDARYDIQLRTVDVFDREGEFVLQLACAGAVLYTVAFTVAPRDGVDTIAIGCIQGGKTADARDAIRSATRALHGIRPKQLMVTLVRALGHDYGCARMVMVSNRNRVIYKAIKHGRVLADYDELWEELGARRRDDGDYELDCLALMPPDLAAIESKKRSEAKKRYEMVSALAREVSVRLRGCPAA